MNLVHVSFCFAIILQINEKRGFNQNLMLVIKLLSWFDIEVYSVKSYYYCFDNS